MIDIKRNHGDLSDVRRHPPINKLSSRTFLLSARVALFPFILMMMTMIVRNHHYYYWCFLSNLFPCLLTNKLWSSKIPMLTIHITDVFILYHTYITGDVYKDYSPPCPVSLLLQTSLHQSQNQRSGPDPKTSFDPSPTVNIPQGSNNTRNSQAGDHLQRSRGEIYVSHSVDSMYPVNSVFVVDWKRPMYKW